MCSTGRLLSPHGADPTIRYGFARRIGPSPVKPDSPSLKFRNTFRHGQGVLRGQKNLGLHPENKTVPTAGLSDYRKLLPFTIEIRQSEGGNSRQSRACATTQIIILLLLRVRVRCCAFLRFRLSSVGGGYPCQLTSDFVGTQS